MIPILPLLLTLSPALQETTEASIHPLLEEVRALEQEYRDARSEVLRAMRELEEAKRGAYYEKHRPSADAYADRFLALAERGPDTEAALEAYGWVLGNAEGEERFRICTDALLKHHVDDRKLGDLCGPIARWPEGVAFLEELAGESFDRYVQGQASYAIGEFLARELDWGTDDPAKREVAERHLERVRAEYADLETRRGPDLGTAAERVLFALRNLAVGKVAPDIEGVDLDGVPFKLSDYRGKVVLLDFWGDW